MVTALDRSLCLFKANWCTWHMIKGRKWEIAIWTCFMEIYWIIGWHDIVIATVFVHIALLPMTNIILWSQVFMASYFCSFRSFIEQGLLDKFRSIPKRQINAFSSITNFFHINVNQEMKITENIISFVFFNFSYAFKTFPWIHNYFILFFCSSS